VLPIWAEEKTVSSNKFPRTKRLELSVKALEKLDIVVGYLGNDRHPNANATIAEVASWMEFGTNSAPARPFMRTATRLYKNDIQRDIKRELTPSKNNLLDDSDSIADKIGEALVSYIQKTIDQASDWATPLALSTIEAKGNSQPLIETGAMKDGVSHETRRR
jgi:hypothetical protein